MNILSLEQWTYLVKNGVSTEVHDDSDLELMHSIQGIHDGVTYFTNPPMYSMIPNLSKVWNSLLPILIKQYGPNLDNVANKLTEMKMVYDKVIPDKSKTDDLCLAIHYEISTDLHKFYRSPIADSVPFHTTFEWFLTFVNLSGVPPKSFFKMMNNGIELTFL